VQAREPACNTVQPSSADGLEVVVRSKPDPGY
jgi:hypothetical protein